MSDEHTKSDEVTLDVLAGIIKAGFDAVDTRFDAVDTRFDAVDARLTAIDERIDSVETRLSGEILSLKKETRDGFVAVNQKLADIADVLEDHEKRISKIEAVQA